MKGNKYTKFISIVIVVLILLNLNISINTSNGKQILQFGGKVYAADQYHYSKYTTSSNVTESTREYTSSATFSNLGTGGTKVIGYTGCYQSGDKFILSGSREVDFGEIKGYYLGNDSSVVYITSGIQRSYTLEFNIGTPYQVTQVNYVFNCVEKRISSTKGTLVSGDIVAPNGTYPDNGVHTDGYWYVKDNGVSVINATSPAENQVIGGGFTPIGGKVYAADHYHYSKYTASSNVTESTREYTFAANFSNLGPIGAKVIGYTGCYQSGDKFILSGPEEVDFDKIKGYYLGNDSSVVYITSGIQRSYTLELNRGTPYQVTQVNYVFNCVEKRISSTEGTLVSGNIVAPNGTYPDNGVHTDGYWYVKDNGVSLINATSSAENRVIGGGFTPTVSVSDPDGGQLTCKYYIDAETAPRDTKVITNTATAQLVSFNVLDTSTLAEGAHTFKFEVNDGIAPPVIQTVNAKVDKSPPSIGNMSVTSTDTGISISGSAADDVAGMSSASYRYTIGQSASPWIADTTYALGSLAPNTPYNIRFEAKDNVWNIASREQSIHTKAHVPALRIGSVSENTLNLSIDDGNPAYTQYQINTGAGYAAADGSLTASPEWITPAGKAVNIRGLNPNTTYTFTAKARNVEGVETAPSAATVKTTLAVPPTIAFTPQRESMTLTWSPVPGAYAYDIRVDGVEINNITASTYIHTGLSPDTAHSYSIRVNNASGAGRWSDTVSSTTLPNPPNTPTGISSEVSQTWVKLAWDRALNATGYDIEADGRVVDSVQGTGYTHQGLAPDSPHTYRVRAKNAGGESPWSEALHKTTLPNPPPIPSNINTALTKTSIALTWDRAERATGYEVEVDGATVYIGDVPSYTHTGLSPATLHTYKVKALNIGGRSQWSDAINVMTHPEEPKSPSNIMTTAEKDSITLTWYKVPYAESYEIQLEDGTIATAKETTYTHTKLTPDTTHKYKIRAKNISGISEWSREVSMFTLPAPSTGGGDDGKNIALSNVAAIVTSNSIAISWDAAGQRAQYDIEVDGQIEDNKENTVYNHTGLEAETYHKYKIRVREDNGKERWCAVLSLSTLPKLPDAPKNIEAKAANDSIELKWERIDGAAGYDLEIDGQTLDAMESTAYIHQNLRPGMSHTYRVRAKNITGVTAWSDALVKSTLSPTYEADCKEGQEFNLSLLATNVQDFTGKKFTITYNKDQLEVADLCELTPAKDTMPDGRIPGTNIKVTCTEGKIQFTVDENIVSGTSWSGEIISTVFKAKTTGKTYIDFYIE